MDAVTTIREDLQKQLISQIWEDEYLIGNVIEDYVKGLNDSDLIDLRKFICLLYTSPSPRDRQKSRMPSSA